MIKSAFGRFKDADASRKGIVILCYIFCDRALNKHKTDVLMI